ncbi:hypothetical protein [Deinococcus hohokamensis]|uniref:Uncharacterized protein n=1 Tax=Deinococcus hohokamensis TaxID=309883 RepID=A0ABV9IA67_9DEIO
MPVVATLTCRWVPGTLDRVRITTPHHEEIWSIQDIARRFGRDAVNALYLHGKYIATQAL